MVVAVAMGLASCGSKEKCYEITTSIGSISTSAYVWGKQADVDAAVEQAKKAAGSVATVTYKAVSKAKSDCVGVSM